MFRFHIQGLCIAVLGKDALTVLMLNSSVRQRRIVPHHLPSLFVKREGLESTSAAKLPSIAGRWLPERNDEGTVGFDLTGLRLAVGVGAAPVKTTAKGLIPGQPPHPVGKPLDWTSLDWVLNAARLLPKAPLRERFRRLGPDTTTIVEFRGGRLEGGKPVGEEGSFWIWKVSDAYEQAFTDTIDVVYDEAPTVIMKDAEGTLRGTATLLPGHEAWCVNEAAERARQMVAPVAPDAPAVPFIQEPINDDCYLYLEAFDDVAGVDKDLISIRAVKRFVDSGKIFSTVNCDALLYEE